MATTPLSGSCHNRVAANDAFRWWTLRACSTRARYLLATGWRIVWVSLGSQASLGPSLGTCLR